MWWLSELEQIFGDRFRQEEILKEHTSWHVGGKASFFVEPINEQEILRLIHIARAKSLPLFILGGGTNVLVHDKGFDGIVISTKSLRGVKRLGETMFIFESGVPTSQILSLTRKENLSGWEHMAGIPGTLGGALIGNAGIADKTVAECVVWVESLERNLSHKKWGKDDIKWRYRDSSLAQGDRFVLRACLNFKPSTREVVDSNINYYMQKRSNQPLVGFSAGSVFKNISFLEPAGLLLEKYNCKGLSEGNASVSDRHANFIINHGNATSGEIWRLIKRCRGIVLENHGKWLDLEVNLIGEPWRQ